MSFQLMAWAIEQKTGSAARKSVLLALANRANHDTGLCCPKMSTVAQETELSVRTVERAVEALCSGGFVTRTRTRRRDGSWSVFHYTFPPVTVSGGDDTVSEPPDTESGNPPDSVSSSPPDTESGQEEPGTKTFQPGSRTSNQRSLEAKSASNDLAGTSETTSCPPVLLVAGRNLAHDALAAEAGIGEGSARQREVALALNGKRGAAGIREMLWSEAQRRRSEIGDASIFTDALAWERTVADEVRCRALMYRGRMPEGSLLTPTALWKWWADLPQMADRSADGYNGASVQDILKMTGAKL